MLLGNKNYNLVPFSELIADLEGIINYADEVRQKLGKNLQEFENKNIRHLLRPDFEIIIGNSSALIDLALEFKNYLREIQEKNIEEYHIAKLQDIATVAGKLFSNLHNTFDFTKGKEWLKISEGEYLLIQENIYNPLRGIMNEFKIFSSIAPELKKYKRSYISQGINQVRTETKPPIIPLPQSTRWENITIKFINGHDVEILLSGKHCKKSSCEEMGFLDSKSKRPNEQWKLLESLSLRSGEISWQNNADIPDDLRKHLPKRKQNLSKTLKEVFGLHEDPFHNYRRQKMYRARFLLIPEPGIPT